MIMELPTHSLPVLYGLDSKGKIKVWRAWAYEDIDGTAGFKTLHGLKDGKLQEQGKIIREGKNLGKKNQTSSYEQAIAEITSKHLKKKEQEGYSEDQTSLSIPRLPMLAKNYKDHKNKVNYPVMVQMKLDGIRCLATKINGDTITYKTRKGKPITTVSHLTPSLLEKMQIDETLDGELYSHDLTFQQITAAVKKEREDSLKIEFWIYDVVDPEKDFKYRYRQYYSKKDFPGLVTVESYVAYNEEEVYKCHDEIVKMGYEGAIIRSMTGGYEYKKRSNRLLKLKSFDDAEYQVVGGYEGSGSAEGHVTFICKTTDNKEFGCVPRGNHEYRAALWNNLDRIVAAKSFITVRYFGLTDDGLPRFPVGVSFRSGAINKDGVFEPDL